MTSHTQPSLQSPEMSHQGLGHPRNPDDSHKTYPEGACNQLKSTLLLRRMQSTAYCPKSLLACLCPPSRLSPSISSNLRTSGWTPASSERLPALPIQSCLGLEHGCSCLISSLSWHLASPWPTAETMHICIVLKLMVQHRARSLPAGRGEGSAGGRLLAVNTSATERAGRTKSYFS